jgi:hypothetical protein
VRDRFSESRLAAVLLLAAILLTGCEAWTGEEPEAEEEGLEPAVVERVVADLLARMDAKYEEMGALFSTHLHDMKDEAAREEGLKDWSAFKKGLAATDPKLEVEVANRITERMLELLRRGEEEE